MPRYEVEVQIVEVVTVEITAAGPDSARRRAIEVVGGEGRTLLEAVSNDFSIDTVNTRVIAQKG